MNINQSKFLAPPMDLPKIKFELPSDPLEITQPSQILPPDEKPTCSFFSIDQPLVDSNRERTLSDASSDTVDYDFDSETCAVLTDTNI